ncbi:hypothetical protein J6590_029557 [Homalodisca vitripennis]|nr:hypothetical protein J6590_029557 [Homalodisca vitripennis]
MKIVVLSMDLGPSVVLATHEGRHHCHPTMSQRQGHRSNQVKEQFVTRITTNYIPTIKSDELNVEFWALADILVARQVITVQRSPGNDPDSNFPSPPLTFHQPPLRVTKTVELDYYPWLISLSNSVFTKPHF